MSTERMNAGDCVERDRSGETALAAEQTKAFEEMASMSFHPPKPHHRGATVTFGPELHPGDEGYVGPPHGVSEHDDYGIKQVFADHLDLAMKSMPPDKAFESAQHATRQYLAGHRFQGDGSGGYHMFERQDRGDAMR